MADQVVSEGQGQFEPQHRVEVSADQHPPKDEARCVHPVRTSNCAGSVASSTNSISSGSPKAFTSNPVSGIARFLWLEFRTGRPGPSGPMCQ
jgi:hypothetical protein